MKMIGPVDWAIILWSSVGWGLLAGVVGLKPMVPTVAEEGEERERKSGGAEKERKEKTANGGRRRRSRSLSF